MKKTTSTILLVLMLAVCMLSTLTACSLDCSLGHHYWDSDSIQVITPATCEKSGMQSITCYLCKQTKTEVIPATGHTFGDWTIDCIAGTKTKTCTQCGHVESDKQFSSDGVHKYGQWEITSQDHKNTCSVCGHVEQGAHIWDNGTVTPATCTVAGKIIYKCTVCDHSKEEEIPATGHTYGPLKAQVDATCQAEGTKAHFQCSSCQGYFDENKNATTKEALTIAKLAHTVVVDQAVQATCTTDGKTEGSHCSVCNEVLVAQTIISATGHTEVIDAVLAPTCTTTGLTEGKHCSVCNEVLVAQITVPALGHDFVEGAVTAPTCSKEGFTTYECSRCDATEKRNVTSATGEHNYGADNKCTVCGLEKGHEHVLVSHPAVESTCTLAGNSAYWSCSSCDKFFSNAEATAEIDENSWVLPLAEHKAQVVPGKAPTCTESGLTEGSKCSVCDKVLVEQTTIDKVAHTPGTAVKENEVPATCLSAGSYDSVVYCSVCNTELTREAKTIDQLAHADNDGDFKCDNFANCGTVIPPVADSTLTIEQAIALGNLYTKDSYTADSYFVVGTITELKHTTYGNVYISDANGNKLYVYGILSADGTLKYNQLENKPVVGDTVKLYAPVGKYDEAQMKNACLIDLQAHTHNYNETPDIKIDATCTEDGSKLFYCTICGYENVVTIASPGHTYGEGTVTAPTCSTEGYTSYTCSVCGNVKKDTIVPATGTHNYVDGVCSVCGLQQGHTHTTTAHPANDATCTTAGNSAYWSCTCGKFFSNADATAEISENSWVIEALGHKGTEDFKCDVCEEIVPPTADCPLTIAQANTLGELYEKDKYTEGKYYVTGVISAIITPSNGTIEITDGKGNELYVYKTDLNDQDPKPLVGDTVTVYGKIGMYNSAQLNNGAITAHTPHEHDYKAVVTAPTCTTGGYTTHTCSICKDYYKDTETDAIGHNYVDGVCSACGHEQGSATEAWTLVTDVTTLVAGDKIIIVASGSDVALSTNQKSNNRGAVEVVKSGNIVTFDETGEHVVQVLTLEAGKTAGTFAFNTGSGYLYAASSSKNYLKTEASLSDNSSWTIEIDSNGVVTIKAQGTSTRNWLRYNSSDNLFSCYSSNQQDVSIYKLVKSSSGETPCEHAWDEGTITTPATCTADGERTLTCSKCSQTKTEVIKATGHTLTAISAKDATCTEDGNNAYWSCSVCAKYFLDEDCQQETTLANTVIPKLTHKYGDVDYVWEEDNSSVTATRVCANDETHIETETVSTVCDETPATCQKAGSKVYTATFSNKAFVGQTKTETLDQLLHSYKDNGDGTHSCTNGCNATAEHQYTDGLCVCGSKQPVTVYYYNSYNWTDVYAYTWTDENKQLGVWPGTQATAVVDQDGWYSIVVPGEAVNIIFSNGVGGAKPSEQTNDLTIDATKPYCLEETWYATQPHVHKYTTKVTDPTCTEDGYTSYTCQCGHSYTADTVGKLGHDYQSVVTAPTCGEAGYTTHTCSRCNDSYKDTPVSATGEHNYVDGKCSKCGLLETHTHSYTEVETAPTCTEDGYTTYTCTCGEFYTVDGEPALGHKEADAVKEKEVAPTCTTAGSYDSVVYCSVCKEELSRTTVVVDKLSHTYDNGICSCGAVEIRVEGSLVYDASKIYLDLTNSEWAQYGIGANGLSRITAYYWADNVEAKFDFMTKVEGNLYSVTRPTEATKIIFVYLRDNSEIASWDNKDKQTVNIDISAESNLFVLYNNNWEDNVTGYWSEESIKVACAHTAQDFVVDTTVTASLAESATCTTSAKYYKVCQHCGAISNIVVSNGDPLGHSYGDWTPVEGTDTHARTCKVCLTETQTEAHKWTEATCTTAKTCSVCKATEGEPSGHSFGEWTPVENTDTHSRSCSCGETETNPHAWGEGEQTKDPTCTEKGVKTFTCSDCKATKTEEISMSDHDWTDATCTLPKTCKTCGTTEDDSLGHIDENGDFLCDRVDCTAVVPPKANSTLTIEQANALGLLCADSYTENKYYVSGTIAEVYNVFYGNMYIKDSLGNSLQIYGTYSADGETSYNNLDVKPIVGDTVTIYGVIGQYKDTAQIQNGWITSHTPHEHDYKVVVTAPTCTTGGYTTHTCSICKDSYKDSETDAIGHNYVDGVCSVCGQKEGVKIYSYTFENKVFDNDIATADLGDVNWTFAGNGNGYYGYDATKGQQFGSGSNPYSSLTLTSADFANVTSIKINMSGASSIQATAEITVGGTKVGETITLTKTATDYTIENIENLSGPIVITVTQTSSKAIYIKSIEVEYSTAAEEQPHTHDLTLVPQVDATCTEDGKKAHYTCSGCELLFSDAEGNTQVTAEDLVIPAAHAWEEAWTTNETHHWHECTAENCPITENSEKDGYAEHTFGDWVVAEDTSKHTRSCSCGKVEEKSHAWNEGEETTPATCTKEGVKTITCTACGATKTEAIAVVPHDWADATCTAPKTCKREGCNATEGDPLSHSLTSTEAKSANCTENGNIAYWTCSSCNKYFSDEQCTTEVKAEDLVIVVNPDSHSWGEATYVWSADYTTVTGTRVCKHNSDHTVGDAVQTIYSVTTPATCTKAGEGKYTAPFTSTLFSCEPKTVVISALEHDYASAVTTPATCTTEGVTTYTCKNDATHTYTEAIPALGHTFEDGVCATCKVLLSTKADAEGKVTIYYYNTNNWETVNAHMWDGTAEGTSWPGRAMTNEGNGLWSIEVGKGDHAMIIFNNGSGAQTANLVLDEANPYYAGFFKADAKANTLYLNLNGVWTNDTRFAAYFFNDDGNTWVDMTDSDGNGIYEVAVPAGYSNVIFCRMNSSTTENNWDNKWDQTADLTITNENNLFIVDTNTESSTTWSHYHGYVVVVTPATCTAEGSKALHWTCGCENIDLGVIDKIAHSYTREETTPATCAKDGLATYTCTACEDTYTETIPATGKHTGGTATCTAKAVCEVCGNEYGEINANNHDIQNHEAKAPTCTAIGWNAYETCSRCDYTTYKEISATAHSYESVVTAPTCTAGGYTTYTCTKCRDSYVADETESTGHINTTTATVEATCTTAGSTTVTCACGETISTTVISAKGHTSAEAVEENIVEATCTTAGSYDSVVYCSVCNAEISRESKAIAALGHDEIAHEAQAPTCTAIGWDAYVTCSRCDYTTYKETAALGHTEVIDNAVAATCTATGKTEGSHCSVCQAVIKEQETVPAKGHTEETIPAVDATCTEDGLTAGVKCSVCNTVLVEQETVEALGHDWQWVIDTPATVTTPGVKHEKCTRCHSTQNENTSIDILTCLHESTLNHVEAQTATCTANGNKEYWHCTKCGKYYSDADCQVVITLQDTVINAPGHNYTSVITDPTCIADGYTTYTCTACGHSYTADKTEAKGHTLTETTAKDATCTEAGNSAYWTCATCGNYFSDKQGNSSIEKDSWVTNALGHNLVDDDAVEATCTTAGKEAGKHCTRCSYTEGGAVINALGHDLVDDDAVEATCTTAGKEAGKHCARCSYTEGGAVINALGHTEVIDNAVAATCTATGKTEGKHCSVCNTVIVKQEIVSATGHTIVVDEAVAPTCTATGKTEGSHCSVCNTVLVEQETVDALGHTEETILGTAATCTATGLTDGTKCSVCGETLKAQEEISATGHSYTSVVTDPTCTEQGYTTHTCSCGDTYTDSTVDALGHDYVATVVDPTCEAQGYTIHNCSHCEENYKDTYVMALGHLFAEDFTVDTPATCEVKGSQSRHCTADGCTAKTDITAIATTGHSYVDGTCSACGSAQPTETVTLYYYNTNNWETVSAYMWESSNEVNENAKWPGLAMTKVSEDSNLWSIVVDTTKNYDKIIFNNDDNGKQTANLVLDEANPYYDVYSQIPANTIFLKPNSNWTQANARFAAYFFGNGTTWLDMTDKDGDGIYQVVAPTGYSSVIFCRMDPDKTANEWANKWNQTGNLTLQTNGNNLYTVPDTWWDSSTDETNSVSNWSFKHAHSYTVVETLVTCTAGGSKVLDFTCGCADVTIATYTATGHIYTNDCDTMCNVCHEVRTVEHSYGEVLNAQNGHYQTCATCNNVLVNNHTYTETVTTPATCTEEGVTTFSCDCGHTYTTAIPATGHTYTSQVTKQATCEKAGETTYTCTACGDTYTEEIEALGHNLTTVDAKDPTCTEDGYQAYQQCSRCDYVTEKVVIPATGHTYTNWTKVEGKDKHSCQCSNCEYVETVACSGGKATCENIAVCDVCGEGYGNFGDHVEEAIPAVPATCTATGLTAGVKCSECDKVQTAPQIVKALGHTPGLVSEGDRTESTCTVAGSYEKVTYCSVCNEEASRETITLKLASHTFDSENNVCTVCKINRVTTKYTIADYTEGTQYATAEVHNLGNGVVVTTTDCHFTSELRIYSSTTNNGFAIIESPIAIGSITVNAGYKADTLNIYGSNDGSTWTESTIATVTVTSAYGDYTVSINGEYRYLKLDVAGTNQIRIKWFSLTILCAHANTTESTPTATCTEPAYVVTTCNDCSAIISKEPSGEALGHTEVTVDAVAATCTETGLTEGSHCSICNDILVAQSTVPATGHSWTNVCDTSCNNEGCQYTREATHTYEDNGNGTHSCINGCEGQTAEHEFENGKCTVCEAEDPDYVPETGEEENQPATQTKTYQKVTTAPTDWSGEYLIVYEEGSVIFDSSLTTFDAVANYKSVEIENGTISCEQGDAYKFTIEAIDGGYSAQGSSGKYFGYGSNANGLTTKDTALALTLSLNSDGSVNIISSGGAYLRYNSASNQTRFRFYKSSTYTSQNAICLYKLVTQ